MPLGGLLLLLSSAMVSSNLELHKYATGRQARVVTAMTLLKSHLFR
jgi:20S proteasome subunit beta 2